MTDTLHTIHQSAKRFFSGTLLSRLSGMLRDVLMAFFFGTQPAVAAFMLAFRFSHLFRRLFGEGALQSAFIPLFETLRHEHPVRAFLFFRDLSWTLTLFLLTLIGLGEIVLCGCLFYLDLTPPNQQIIFLTCLMLPSLLFICLYGLNASLLQCEKIYFIPSVAPVVFNMIWILALIGLHFLTIDQAMQGLALVVVGACFCQWLVTYPKLRSILHTHLSHEKSSLTLYSIDVKALLKPLFLGILGVAASQMNNAIDMLFARYAQSDGPALLWYAIRLQQLPLALFGIAMAGAILPPLTRALKAKKWNNYHQFLQDALGRTWNFILPLTLFLFLAGDTCVHLIYGHGEFNNQSIVGTTQCLWGYSFGLVPAALTLVLAPVCYAHQNYHLPAIASLGSMCLNLILNSLFIFGFHWGALSVSIATSLSSWMNLFFLAYVLSRIHSLELFEIFKKNLNFLWAASLACMQLMLFRYYFLPLYPFYYFTYNVIMQFFIVCFLFLIFFTPYLIYISFIYIKEYLHRLTSH